MAYHIIYAWLNYSKYIFIQENVVENTSKTLGLNVLSHCGLVTPYGNRDLGQHWPDGTKPLREPMLTYYE